MKRVWLFVLTLLLSAAPASAQVAADGDARVESISFSAPPTVNQTSSVTAFINVTRPATVEVAFRYADGSDINPLDPARSGSGSSVTRVLTAAGSHPVTISFTPPAQRKGDAQIVVVATMEADSNRSNDRLAQPTFIRYAALAVAFEPLDTPFVAPEGSAFAAFTVHNLGNVNDTPAALASPTSNATHWNVTMLEQPREVGPGNVTRGVVLVRALSANETVNTSAWVMVVSSIQQSVQTSAASGSFAVNASELRMLRELSATLPDNIQLFPGETLRTNLTLHNRGARGDVFNLSLRLTNDSAGWNATFGEVITGAPHVRSALVPVAKNASANVTITLQRATTAIDTMPFTVNVTALDEEVLAPHWPDKPYRRSVTAMARTAQPVLTILPIDSATAYEGDAVTFRVRVANEGRMSANDTLVVEVRDNLRVVANWATPLANISPGGLAENLYVVNVTGITGRSIIMASLSTPPAGPNSVVSRTANLTVRAPSISLTAPDAWSVRPGSRLALLSLAEGLAVGNGGDTAERIVVQLRSPTAAWLDQEWLLDVPPHARVPVSIDVLVPEKLSSTRFEAHVTAWVEARPSFLATTAIEILAFDDEAPAITWEPPEQTPAVGEEVPLRAIIVDSLGIGHAAVLITAPSGRTVLVDLLPTTTASEFLATFVPDEAGDHRLELRARDAAEPANTRIVSDVLLDVAASPYAGVRPATVRDGGSTNVNRVRFVEIDAGTTRSVEIDAGEGFTLVAYPYELAMTGPDGPRLLRTRATSLQGIVVETTWNITLDRLAPTIGAPTVNQVTAGLEVRVEAAGAANVSGWIETPSGQRDLDFRRGSTNTFAAVVPGAATWTTLSVQAKDAAGNEASVRATSSEPRPMPAISTGLLLLAISGLALLMRRRG